MHEIYMLAVVSGRSLYPPRADTPAERAAAEQAFYDAHGHESRLANTLRALPALMRRARSALAGAPVHRTHAVGSLPA